MLFELHLTTEPTVDIQRWMRWCATEGIKPLDIRLLGDAPAHDRQIMMAATFEGNNVEALKWVSTLQDAAAFEGFPLVRSKLEVPLDKSEPFQGRLAYYECHVKSLVPDTSLYDALENAEEYGWHASYNALYKLHDDLVKLYLTKRCAPEIHYLDAGHRFALAFGDLATYAFHTVRMESEAVVVDTQPDLDKGWAAL